MCNRNSLRAATLMTVLALVGAPARGGVDKAADKEFRASLGNTTVTVFPAFVRGQSVSFDDSAAPTIAAALTQRGLARAEASGAHVPIGGEWHHNQAKMFQESASAFVKWLAANPVSTSYALLPEYLGYTDHFVGVHFYIVDSQGRLAHAELFNSHWKEFSTVDPKTAADCTRVVIAALEKLRPTTK